VQAVAATHEVAIVLDEVQHVMGATKRAAQMVVWWCRDWRPNAV